MKVEEIERYSRQLIVKNWSSGLQAHFRNLHVALPTGLPSAALYLAGVGVGAMSIAPEIKASNLLLKHIAKLNSLVTLGTYTNSDALSADCEIILNPRHIVSTDLNTTQATPNAKLIVSLQTDPPELRLTTSEITKTSKLMPSSANMFIEDHLLAGTAAACMIISWWSKRSGCEKSVQN